MGTCHIWHGKKRMTAHILSYRRIRRYLALSLKATEEHVTLVMWDPQQNEAEICGVKYGIDLLKSEKKSVNTGYSSICGLMDR